MRRLSLEADNSRVRAKLGSAVVSNIPRGNSGLSRPTSSSYNILNSGKESGSAPNRQKVSLEDSDDSSSSSDEDESRHHQTSVQRLRTAPLTAIGVMSERSNDFPDPEEDSDKDWILGKDGRWKRGGAAGLAAAQAAARRLSDSNLLNAHNATSLATSLSSTKENDPKKDDGKLRYGDRFRLLVRSTSEQNITTNNTQYSAASDLLRHLSRVDEKATQGGMRQKGSPAAWSDNSEGSPIQDKEIAGKGLYHQRVEEARRMALKEIASPDSSDEDNGDHVSPSRKQKYETARLIAQRSFQQGPVTAGNNLNTNFIKACGDYKLAPRPSFLMRDKSDTRLLRGCGATLASAMAAGLRNDQGVRRVILRDNGLTCTACVALAEALQGSSVHELDLANNNIGGGGLVALGKVLASGTISSLKKIDLEGNHFRDRDLVQFAADLGQHGEMEHLVMRRTGCWSQRATAAFAQLLKSDQCYLKYLDVSWNSLRAQAAMEFVNMLLVNRSLEELYLGWNRFGGQEVGDAFATMLETNDTLQVLHLPHNFVSEQNAIVMAESLYHNRTVRELNLQGNSLGLRGGQALLQLAHDKTMDALRIDFSECTFSSGGDVSSMAIPDVSHHVGPASLKLTEPLQRAVCQGLYRRSCNEDGQLCDVKLNGKPFEVSPDGDWVVPNAGKFECDFRARRRLGVRATDKACMLIHDALGMGKEGRVQNERHAQGVLSAASRHWLFSPKQAISFLERFQSSELRATIACMFFNRLSDQSPFSVIMKVLTSMEQTHVRSILGDACFFNLQDVSGHYLLDLSSSVQYDIAVILSIISSEERVELEKAGIALTTSQFGDGHSFRNTKLNEKPTRIDDKWSFPSIGRLELDFVQRSRPASKSLRPMQDSEVEAVRLAVEEHGDLPSHPHVLREGLSERCLLSCQAAQLIKHLSPQYRSEAAVLCFSHVMDLENYLHDLDEVLTVDQGVTVVHRLGYRNVWNPMHAERYYTFDLSFFDERSVAIDLVDLAVAEPEENWKNESFNGKLFQLPLAWTSNVPKSGVLCFTYWTKIKVIRYRRTMQKKCLCFDAERFAAELEHEATDPQILKLEKQGLKELEHARERFQRMGKQTTTERYDDERKRQNAKAAATKLKAATKLASAVRQERRAARESNGRTAATASTAAAAAAAHSVRE